MAAYVSDNKSEVIYINMIYIPQLWGAQTKPVITVGAEKRGKLNPGKLEWGLGHPMLADGMIIRAGLTSDRGTIAVNLVINGEDTGYQITKLEGQHSGVVVFENPLKLQQGDSLNFKTTVSSGNVRGGAVSVLIELDYLT